VDPLTAHDVEVSRGASPSEKLAQALELMEAGLRLKRAALQRANPDATERDIDEAFERWLLDDG
jgi:hypothetical protein